MPTKKEKTTSKDSKVKRPRGRIDQFTPKIKKAMADGSLERWLTIGRTQKEICGYLEVAETQWYDHLQKNDIQGFKELLDKYKDSRINVCYSNMWKIAQGYYYQDWSGQFDRDGKPIYVTKFMPPDRKANSMLMHNYLYAGKQLKKDVPEEWWSDTATVIQARELELKQQEYKDRQADQKANGQAQEIMEWFSKIKAEDKEDNVI